MENYILTVIGEKSGLMKSSIFCFFLEDLLDKKFLNLIKHL